MSTHSDLLVDRLARRVQASDYERWRAKVTATAGCAQPVRMTGQWALHDAHTGSVLKQTAGEIFAPCGNRREAVCPACSDRYAADAFHLLRAGLAGGSKGVPETVAEKPRLFVTLTAPSFGAVHNRRVSRNGKTMPCACGAFHHEADPRRGQPLDPDTYDYLGHVLWQAHSGKLWNRFTVKLRRYLAHAAGLRVRDFPTVARLSFAKVAEYQARGVIHFHAVIRLDGPAGPGDPSPSWATADVLSEAVRSASQAVHLMSPEVDGQRWTLAWGEQVDIRPIRAYNAAQLENEHGEITDDRLASYVAKYATKGTSTSEAVDRPIRSQGHLDLLDINPHHRRIIQTAWDLGAPVACPNCADHTECPTCGGSGLVTRTTRAHRLGLLDPDKVDPLDELKTRRWAHMLGFRGHFLSKSRDYSTTFKQIRGDRRQYRHEAALEELGVGDDDVTVVNHWAMTSVGHDSPEEAELAEAIAHQQRQLRKQRYTTERKD